MNKKLRVISIIALALISVALLAWPVVKPLVTERLLRRNCGDHLRSLFAFLESYKVENRDRPPTSLESLDEADKELIVPILLCPGKRVSLEMASDGTNFGDYVYIDWSRAKSSWTQRPLMYDRRLGHHNNQGVNILMSDGSVKWDPHARWLRAFAAAHPEATFPVPE